MQTRQAARGPAIVAAHVVLPRFRPGCAIAPGMVELSERKIPQTRPDFGGPLKVNRTNGNSDTFVFPPQKQAAP